MGACSNTLRYCIEESKIEHAVVRCLLKCKGQSERQELKLIVTRVFVSCILEDAVLVSLF